MMMMMMLAMNISDSRRERGDFRGVDVVAVSRWTGGRTY
jgi:hypothetical protein